MLEYETSAEEDELNRIQMQAAKRPRDHFPPRPLPKNWLRRVAPPLGAGLLLRSARQQGQGAASVAHRSVPLLKWALRTHHRRRRWSSPLAVDVTLETAEDVAMRTAGEVAASTNTCWQYSVNIASMAEAPAQIERVAVV